MGISPMIYESRDTPVPVAPFFFTGDFIHVATGPKVQVFTGNGTYTPSAGLVAAIIECVGGGGGGGGAASNGANLFYIGAGGGAGSYSRAYKTAAQIGASVPPEATRASARSASVKAAGAVSVLGSQTFRMPAVLAG
jgi:hypothetical protein